MNQQYLVEVRGTNIPNQMGMVFEIDGGVSPTAEGQVTIIKSMVIGWSEREDFLRQLKPLTGSPDIVVEL